MNVRELITKLGFKTDPAGAIKADKLVADYTKKTKEKLTELRNFGAKFSLFISTPLALAGVSAIKVAAEFEQINVAFETMIGNASAAQTLVKNLFDFAEKTPFNIADVQTGAKRLLAYGIAADDIIPTLTSLGNIAAGVGKEKLPFLITALGQVRAKTVLSGEELKQFTETGVPLIDELSKVTGISVKEIVDDTKRLGITYEQVRQALENLSADGGKFARLLEKQSRTIEGTWSNLQDSITRLKAEFGDLFNDEVKFVIEKLRALVDWFKKLDPEVKKAIGYFSILLVIVGPLVTAFAQLGLAIIGIKPLLAALAFVFAPVSLAVLAIVAAIGIAIGLFYILYDDIKTYFEGGDSLTGIFVDFWHAQVEWAKNIYVIMSDFFKMIVDDFKTAIMIIVDYAKNPLGTLAKMMNGTYKRKFHTLDEYKTIGDEYDAAPDAPNMYKLYKYFFQRLRESNSFKDGVDGGRAGSVPITMLQNMRDVTGRRSPDFGQSTIVVPPSAKPVNVTLNSKIEVDVNNADAKKIGDVVEEKVVAAIDSHLINTLRDLSSAEVVA